MLKKVILFFTRLFFKIFFKIEVKGLKNIPETGPLIIAANHISNYDPPAIIAFASIKRKDIYVIAKQELFKNKIFGYFLKKMGAIPIDRSKPQISSIKKSIEVLNKKNSLLIFPEGTRKKISNVNNSKDGFAFIASKTYAKIVPTKITIAQNNSKLGKIIIVFDKPLNLKDYEFYNKKDLRKISKEIMTKIYSLHI